MAKEQEFFPGKARGPLADTIDQIMAGLVVPEQDAEELHLALENEEDELLRQIPCSVYEVIECPSCEGPMTSEDGSEFTCASCGYMESR